MNTSKTFKGTVTYLVREHKGVEEICLAWKNPTPNAVKRKLNDKWNGYGGGFESEDISIEVTAVRELYEEGGITGNPEDVEKVADILFVNPWGEYHVDFFLLRKFKGEPKDTEEMSLPTYFPFRRDALPLEKMMDSDKYVLTAIADGKKPKGTIWHDDDMNVVRKEIEYVDGF